MEIRGASAIVTGGASGLGAATARKLASCGMDVVIADIQDDAGEEMAMHVSGAYVPCDVTNPDQVQLAIETATEMGKSLRVVVNCAGISRPERTLKRDGSTHRLETFVQALNINLVGTFNVIRLAAARMAGNDPLESNERGAIVNTASIAAYDGQIGQAAYSASKAGIVGMTLPLARDLSVIGVRVNTIAPGIIDTPLLAGLPGPAKESLGQQVLHPKRLGTPHEFAELVWFLVTHGYMNGETVRMDGGIRMGPR